jgi:hypothetical protein
VHVNIPALGSVANLSDAAVLLALELLGRCGSKTEIGLDVRGGGVYALD